MRLATALVLVLVVAGCSSTASSSTYTLADGKVYTQTDCPAAANLLIGGHRAADALPMKGQTDRSRVEAELAAVTNRLMRSNDVVAVAAVPRNGEVWYPLADGGFSRSRQSKG